jgi:hypothetical protein
VETEVSKDFSFKHMMNDAVKASLFPEETVAPFVSRKELL